MSHVEAEENEDVEELDDVDDVVSDPENDQPKPPFLALLLRALVDFPEASTGSISAVVVFVGLTGNAHVSEYSVNESSTKCDSHSRSATSSVCNNSPYFQSNFKPQRTSIGN